MIVYKTQFDGLCGPVVYDNFQDALAEYRVMVEEGLEVGLKFTIMTEEMSVDEFEQMEEFGGY